MLEGTRQGLGVHLATNQASSMLTFSERYAGATTDVQRAAFIGAGEALLAIHNPGSLSQGTGMYVSPWLRPL
jgi:hypothetical protein